MAGSWPHGRSAVLDWLIGPARRLPNAPVLVVELAQRLIAAGLPLARVSFHVRTLHPQQFGLTCIWRPDLTAPEIAAIPHGAWESDSFRQSPLRQLYIDQLPRVRQRLDLPDEALPFLLYRELKAEGLTDYCALPMTFLDGKIHSTTWSTDRPGGFTEAELSQIEDLLPVFSLLVEIHLRRRITLNLLNTYVGRHAGERILEGQITRGSGTTVDAAIWFCDLRGFTALSERAGRDELLACLNQYFDCMGHAVEAEGGEILKFVGDAMLAIFPVGEANACRRALDAALNAQAAMAALNQARAERAEEALRFGIALHVGEVMYGNIGTASRLDFTVIGPAVNLASRIEGLCRELGAEILISDSFLKGCAGGRPLRSLGRHRLAGIERTVELFTPQAGIAP
jgi:adenylate cyclase